MPKEPLVSIIHSIGIEIVEDLNHVLTFSGMIQSAYCSLEGASNGKRDVISSIIRKDSLITAV